MGLQELLKKHRFAAHPFDTWIAEGERSLPEWFVPPAFLRTISGDAGGSSGPLVLRSNVVFGRPGDGKTAIRLILERELEARAPNALVLRYIDFSTPLSTNKRPSVGQHVDELLRLGTMGLLSVWQVDPTRYANLTGALKKELAWLVNSYYATLLPQVREAYADRISPFNHQVRKYLKQGAKLAIDGYNTVISILSKERIEPVKWNGPVASDPEVMNPLLKVQRFWSVANAMGVGSVWILIDKVDEAPGTQSPEAIFDCVADLLLSQTLLEYQADNSQVIGFKVFLTYPDEMAALLKKAYFRYDRIKAERISWSRKDLNMALVKRLSHFSTGAVAHFDQICAAGAQGAHDRLLDGCELRPRTLFRMAHEVFAEFQRTADATSELLPQSAVDAGILAGRAAVVG